MMNMKKILLIILNLIEFGLLLQVDEHLIKEAGELVENIC